MSADDVYQAYIKKNLVNHQRQESGYVQEGRGGFEAHLSGADAPQVPGFKFQGESAMG